MIGKRIGIHATGMVLLKAMLARHQIPENQVSIVPIGSDMMPLLSGRVDAVAGWQTNVSALKALGAERVDMSLWDSGVRLYALPYYAHTDTLRDHPDLLQRFLRATASGWHHANRNRDQAVELLVKEFPNQNQADGASRSTYSWSTSSTTRPRPRAGAAWIRRYGRSRSPPMPSSGSSAPARPRSRTS